MPLQKPFVALAQQKIDLGAGVGCMQPLSNNRSQYYIANKSRLDDQNFFHKKKMMMVNCCKITAL